MGRGGGVGIGGRRTVPVHAGVIPADAGIQGRGVCGLVGSFGPICGAGPDGAVRGEASEQWIPAFAGMTAGGGVGCCADCGIPAGAGVRLIQPAAAEGAGLEPERVQEFRNRGGKRR